MNLDLLIFLFEMILSEEISDFTPIYYTHKNRQSK